MLREKREFDYTKVMNRYEMAVSFPTEMSLPFIYTLDVPTLVSVSGKAKFEALPHLSSENLLRKPNQVTMSSDIKFVLSSKVQAKISFTTPFNSEQYTCGYDKNMQLYLPINSEISYNVANRQLNAEIQPLEPKKNMPLIHYETTPYTAIHNIRSLHSEANRPNTKVIENRQPVLNNIFGAKQGMAFQVQYTAGQNIFNPQWIMNQLMQQKDPISVMLAPYFNNELKHSQFVVLYNADKSPAHKLKLRMGHIMRYQAQPESSETSIVDIKKFKQLPTQSKERQEMILKLASAGIQNCKALAVDASVEFVGQPSVEYTITAAVSKSNVQPLSRQLFFFKRESKNNEIKPYQCALSVLGNFPNTNGLDFEYALKFDPKSQVQAQLAFGEDYTQQNQIQINAAFSQSEQRKTYLENSWQAKECRQQMRQGNYQLPACANLTQAANLMDRVFVELKHEHLTDNALNNSAKLYSLLRHAAFFKLEENWVNPQGAAAPKHLTLQARFEPDLESVNVTLRAEKLVASFDNLRLNEWAQRLFIVHPVFSAPARIAGRMFQWGTYRRKCLLFNLYFN